MIRQGKGGMGENARIWSSWGQACFPPGAFGGTIGNGNLVGFAGRNRMGLSHLRRLKDNMGKFSPLRGSQREAMLFV